jgi:hypothetical protein
MDWFFFESMWFPVIVGIVLGCIAFTTDALNNLFGGIILVFATAFFSAIGALLGFMLMIKIAVVCFVMTVLTFCAMFAPKKR